MHKYLFGLYYQDLPSFTEHLDKHENKSKLKTFDIQDKTRKIEVY